MSGIKPKEVPIKRVKLPLIDCEDGDIDN